MQKQVLKLVSAVGCKTDGARESSSVKQTVLLVLNERANSILGDDYVILFASVNAKYSRD